MNKIISLLILFAAISLFAFGCGNPERKKVEAEIKQLQEEREAYIATASAEPTGVDAEIKRRIEANMTPGEKYDAELKRIAELKEYSDKMIEYDAKEKELVEKLKVLNK